VFDPFISLYDTMVSDRGLRSAGSATARLASIIDRWSLRRADQILADTLPQLEFYDSLVPGASSKGVVIPVGADDRVFTPAPSPERDERLVVFHGTMVPLQGVTTIAEAAALLEPEGVRFSLIGDGQERPALEASLSRSGATVELTGMVPLEDLPALLSRAAVCLGIFGGSEKAGRVVPHKLYECLALGRPVVTRESPAVDGLFRPGEVVTVRPADPKALADAIRSLVEDPVHREEVARAGLAAYRERFHEEPLSRLLGLSLRTATERGNRPG
jgi:glycosyltransferase involved in cell wall biosynthesis